MQKSINNINPLIFNIMKKLILVFITLISLCSYSQRDPNKIPFYFFIENINQDYDSIKYYVAEVLFTNDLGNDKAIEKLNYKHDICFYDTIQEAVIFELDKNKDYKISFKNNNKIVNIYVEADQEEPKYYLSMDLNFSANKVIRVYFDKESQYYLLETKTLP